MQRVDYRDDEGRMYTSILPDGVDPDEQADMGIMQGPPSLTRLNLPVQVEVRLHNELYVRGIFTMFDVRAKTGEVVAALQAALQVDAQTIAVCYANPE